MKIIGTSKEIDSVLDILLATNLNIEYEYTDIKTCKVCGKTYANEKLIAKHFYKMKTGKGGYMAKCIECYNEERRV